MTHEVIYKVNYEGHYFELLIAENLSFLKRSRDRYQIFASFSKAYIFSF